MNRMSLVPLALLMLTTSIYSAAGTEDKKLVCVAAEAGTLVVSNNTWRPCPKDFDVVSLYDDKMRKCFVSYPHTEVKETGSYRICVGVNEIYFFDEDTGKRLSPLDTEEDDADVIHGMLCHSQQRGVDDEILPPIPPYIQRPASVHSAAEKTVAITVSTDGKWKTELDKDWRDKKEMPFNISRGIRKLLYGRRSGL